MPITKTTKANVRDFTFRIAPYLSLTNEEDTTCPNCGAEHDPCAVSGCDNPTICYTNEDKGITRDPFLFCDRCTNLMDAAEYMHGKSFSYTPRLRHMLDVILGVSETFEDPQAWQRTPWNED